MQLYLFQFFAVRARDDDEVCRPKIICVRQRLPLSLAPSVLMLLNVFFDSGGIVFLSILF